MTPAADVWAASTAVPAQPAGNGWEAPPVASAPRPDSWSSPAALAAPDGAAWASPTVRLTGTPDAPKDQAGPGASAADPWQSPPRPAASPAGSWMPTPVDASSDGWSASPAAGTPAADVWSASPASGSPAADAWSAPQSSGCGAEPWSAAAGPTAAPPEPWGGPRALTAGETDAWEPTAKALAPAGSAEEAWPGQPGHAWFREPGHTPGLAAAETNGHAAATLAGLGMPSPGGLPAAGLPPGGRFDPRSPAGAPSREGKGKLTPVMSAIIALAVLLGGAGAYYVFGMKKSPAGASANTPPATVIPKGPEQVLSVAPANGAASVNGAGPFTVHFAKALARNSPMPALSPAIPGSWAVTGNDAVFTPDKGYDPGTTVTLTVPAGATGVVTTGNGKLAAPVTSTFTTGQFSTARLEQLLAQFGYLPLTWTQTSTTAAYSSPSSSASPSGSASAATPSATSPAPLTANQQWSAAFSPPSGTYSWTSSNYPVNLTSLWTPDAPSEILRGAVMAFQADHNLMSDMVYENQSGLTLTGAIGQRLWAAVFQAVQSNQVNTHGYTYALATQTSPEYLTVWHNGQQIFHQLANTGIGVAPTAVRTDPVYIRYQNQIMKGTNPDGTKYADPVAWVAYFHSGEAIHYFPRGSYGSPQSLGCVELPYAQAQWLWPYLSYGTLVTVTAP